MERNHRRNLPRRRCGSGGMALGTVIALISLVMLTLMTMSNVAITAMRLTSNGRDKAVSLSLAEAGIDYAVEQVQQSAQAYHNSYGKYRNTWTPNGLQIALTDSDGNAAGTFTVSAVNGTNTLGATNWNEVIVTSVGATPWGARRTVQAKIAINGLYLPGGAMISNGGIKTNGGIEVLTASGPAGNADVLANGAITTNGSFSSGYIDGDIASAITVDPRWPNGISYAPRIDFPTQNKIDQMQAALRVDAAAGATPVTFPAPLTLTATQITNLKATGVLVTGLPNLISEPNPMTPAQLQALYSNGIPIKGPKLIRSTDGSAFTVTLNNGDAVNFQGGGPIYLDNGSVNMKSGSTVTNDGILAVTGTFSQGAGSSYSADPVPTVQDPNPTPPTLYSFYVSSGSNDPAVSLNGHPTNNYSTVYAVNGGISVGGSSTITGSLVAGGEIQFAITAGGNYTQKYINASAKDSPDIDDPVVKSWIEL